VFFLQNPSDDIELKHDSGRGWLELDGFVTHYSRPRHKVRFLRLNNRRAAIRPTFDPAAASKQLPLASHLLFYHSHLTQPTEIVVFGSGALLLDPLFEGRMSERETNDIDSIVPLDRELQLDADKAFWSAIEATNRELEPAGLYISHIFPEKEVVLTSEWNKHIHTIGRDDLVNLKLSRPRILDLIVSKMGRGDPKDIEDIGAMLALEPVAYADLLKASENLRVPVVYEELFFDAKSNVLKAVELFENKQIVSRIYEMTGGLSMQEASILLAKNSPHFHDIILGTKNFYGTPLHKHCFNETDLAVVSGSCYYSTESSRIRKRPRTRNIWRV